MRIQLHFLWVLKRFDQRNDIFVAQLLQNLYLSEEREREGRREGEGKRRQDNRKYILSVQQNMIYHKTNCFTTINTTIHVAEPTAQRHLIKEQQLPGECTCTCTCT